MHGWYDWSGGREALVRFGPADAPVVALAIAPFEEANRTRTFAVGMLRQLADRGIASILPDLPGTGESLLPTEAASVAEWRAAFAAAARGADYSITIRAGALVDADAPVKGRWRFAPQDGASLVRELVRTRIANAREEGTVFDASIIDDDGPPIPIAGNTLPRPFLRELRAAVPGGTGPIRTVRLDSDWVDADLKVSGTPLWRRAEPGNEETLAIVLADDIAQWITAECAAKCAD